MDRSLKYACVALALASLIGVAVADESTQAGRDVFVRNCRSCHGGTAGPADFPIGPQVDGIIGTKAGTRPGGMHSRATLESTVVWDRDKLRGFLSVPRRVVPTAIMPDTTLEPAELESLLDYLESLH